MIPKTKLIILWQGTLIRYLSPMLKLSQMKNVLHNKKLIVADLITNKCFFPKRKLWKLIPDLHENLQQAGIKLFTLCQHIFRSKNFEQHYSSFWMSTKMLHLSVVRQSLDCNSWFLFDQKTNSYTNLLTSVILGKYEGSQIPHWEDQLRSLSVLEQFFFIHSS